MQNSKNVKKFKLSFNKKYMAINITCIAIFTTVMLWNICMIFLIRELYQIFLFLIVVTTTLILMTIRSIFGSVKVYNRYFVINYGFAFVNKKIEFDNVISISFLSSNDIVPRAQPAYGSLEKTLKLTYNDIHYNKKSIIYVSLDDPNDFCKTFDNSKTNVNIKTSPLFNIHTDSEQ